MFNLASLATSTYMCYHHNSQDDKRIHQLQNFPLVSLQGARELARRASRCATVSVHHRQIPGPHSSCITAPLNSWNRKHQHLLLPALANHHLISNFMSLTSFIAFHLNGKIQYLKYHLTEMVNMKNCWQGCGEIGTLVPVGSTKKQ